MKEGRKMERQKKKTKEKIGYNLIPVAFYYTEICPTAYGKLNKVVQNNDFT